MVVCSNSWWFVVGHDGLWWFMVVCGGSVVDLGGLWWFTVAHGDLWCFMVVHDGLW